MKRLASTIAILIIFALIFVLTQEESEASVEGPQATSEAQTKPNALPRPRQTQVVGPSPINPPQPIHKKVEKEGQSPLRESFHKLFKSESNTQWPNKDQLKKINTFHLKIENQEQNAWLNKNADEFLKIIGSMENIRQISFVAKPGMWSEFTGKGFKELGNLKKLYRLDALNFPINSEGLKEIATLPTLQVLYCADLQIAPYDLYSLVEAKKLKSIWFEDCPNLTIDGMVDVLKDSKTISDIALDHHDRILEEDE